MAPDDEPAIRAGWSARVLRTVEDLEPAVRQAIADAVGTELVEHIREQPTMGWLPMGDHVRVLEALVSAIGPEEARRLLRETSLRNLRSSLLAASVSATLRVFGVGPLALVRMFPRGFGLITRNCGCVTVTTSRDTPGTRIEFDALPDEMRRPAWAVSMTAVFDALMDIGKVVGTVEADTTALSSGRLQISMLAENRDALVHDVDDR